MAPSTDFKTDKNTAENYNITATLFLEPIPADGVKTLKLKIWLERFHQYTDRVYEIKTEPLIEGKDLTDKKAKVPKS